MVATGHGSQHSETLWFIIIIIVSKFIISKAITIQLDYKSRLHKTRKKNNIHHWDFLVCGLNITNIARTTIGGEDSSNNMCSDSCKGGGIVGFNVPLDTF